MKRIIYLLVGSFAFQYGYTQVNALPQAKHRFIVIAHRGDHVKVPENTLAAYKNGIKNGVDYVEIDLRTTKDSVLVIMHDATVDRMTNGKGKISDLTFSDLRKLKIFDKSGDSAKFYQIPSFEEVLKTCQNKIYIYLDYKDANVRQAFALINKYGMKKQMIVYINSPDQFTEWRQVDPTMPLMLSLPENVKTSDDFLRFLKEYPVDVLDGDWSDYTKEIVDLATKSGITAWPDIQSRDEYKNWDRALNMGFKGLQTDHPADLINYLNKKGLR